MMIQPSSISCGIKQLYQLQGEPRTWKSGLKNVEKLLYGFGGCDCPDCKAARVGQEPRPYCRFVIFSDADWNRAIDPPVSFGLKFAEYLEKQGLGKPTEVSTGVNPNTGHRIRLWSWELPDYKVFKEFLDRKEEVKPNVV